MIKIPGGRQWVSSGRSDVAGSLFSSLGLNLTEQPGKTRVSPRFLITTNQVNGASPMGTPVAFRGFAGNVFAVAPAATPGQTGIYQCTGGILTTAFTVNSTTGSGATNYSCDYSDMEIFNSKICVSGSDDAIVYGDGDGWTSTGSHGGIISSVLSSNANHKLMNFLFLKRLIAFASLTQIISINTSFVAATSSTNTFNLANATASTDLFLVSMIQASNMIWILTANFYNNECYVYTWDGVTADTYQSSFRIDARGALAGIVKDGTPYIIDTDGRLLFFNGGAFVLAPNGQLPIKASGYLTNPISQKNNRWIHPNGISIVDGRINILINNLNHDNGSTINENIASGVWEYDPTIGWYHKGLLSKYDFSAITPTITDYGQNRLSRVGALYNLKKDDRSSATVLGTMLVGADYYNDATTVKSAIFTNDSLDTLQKYGYFVTSKIFSSEIKDTFRKLYMWIRKFLTPTDLVVVKYRSNDVAPLEITGTWTSATTFNTNSDLSGYAIGDEVEGIAGDGSGRCSQISAVTLINATPTWAVTLSETLGGSSGTAKLRLQKWKKLGSFNDQTLQLLETADLGTGTLVQIKTCMLFTGDGQLLNTILDTVPQE